ncbi:MAG TPA: hypothetical protein ENH29_09230 [Bacteroidetes bacterium]|nr:hypothetical protein [Bacteroidota bacterium]
MWHELLAVFFLGGFFGLDTTAAWQVLFSHPLFACVLVGLLFGQPQLGLFFGIIFELIWLYDIPVGGSKFPEGNLSTFIGLMIVLSLPSVSGDSQPWLILVSSIYVLIIAYFLGVTISWMRKMNRHLVEKADRFAEEGNEKKIERMHLLSVFNAYLHGAFWAVIFYLTGLFLTEKVLHYLPNKAPFTMDQLQTVFLATGLVVMFDLFFSRKNIVYFFLGLICGIGLGIIL